MPDLCKHCVNGWFDGRYGQDVECVNGVLIDIDEAHEGASNVMHPLAPCHPNFKTQEPNDSCERLEEWRGTYDDECDEYDDCGLGPDGQCSKAGSEECDWDCGRLG